jgi:beta-galactosidase/beta-glucuronidase
MSHMEHERLSVMAQDLSSLREAHPTPNFARPGWTSLDGEWDFAYDDGDVGRDEGWFEPGSAAFGRTIMVPFPPESPASGVNDTGFHSVLWYRLTITAEQLGNGGERESVLHFGAVDQVAQVWCDGNYLGEHVGGQTPFSFALPQHPARGGVGHTIVVRAFDDPLDSETPRGKQDWRESAHSIWYNRTSGIWQPVWLESVARSRVHEVVWRPSLLARAVDGELTLSERPAQDVRVRIVLSHQGGRLAELSYLTGARTSRFRIPIDALDNAEEAPRLYWSPESPALIDAVIELEPLSGPSDLVTSYFGFREVAVGSGAFLLNERPYYLRSVLEQGYWPESHLAAPSGDALRAEVESIKALGFNAARIHQKAEDPRFLYWADRLGLMLWGESAAAYTFSSDAVVSLANEWSALVRRDRNHPAIVTWVPFNESWGVHRIGASTQQQQFSQSLTSLTRALDPTRPVVSNDGWEHVDSDILSVHDYSDDPDTIRARYGTTDAAAATIRSGRPAHRALTVSEAQRDRYSAGIAPLMLTEFGGISYAGDGSTWGYSTVESDQEFIERLRALFDAVRDCSPVVGFCYTQLTDTMQEANGLLRADRTPKVPIAELHAVVTGESV